MNHTTLQCQDPIVFQSVWERVMKDKPNPIVIGSAPKKPVPTPVPTQVPPLCFGELQQADILEKALVATVDSLEDFQKLEKQLPHRCKSALHPLIQQCKKRKNQLDTAYFLLKGEYYTNYHPQTTPVPADQRLRHRFIQGQKWQVIYQKTAFACEDSCLTSLFLLLELAMKEEVLALHSLIETVIWLKHN